MRHPELPIVSFTCIIFLLCSLPSHIRAGSVSTISLIAWLGIMSLIRGINSLIWANNVVVKAQIWCDIATKITIGFTYAVPAAALCILRHLESVASTRNARTTSGDKRRRQIFEACMCFGLPIFFMALHYIVQGHRYDLFEDFGCYPAVYFSSVSIVIIWVPPLLMSFTSFVYAAMALRHFLRHRIEFATHLHNCKSAISPGRYFRLMSMAVVEMVWDTGINIYIIWFNTITGIRPWTNWADVHSNFSRIGVVPLFLNPPAFLAQLIWQWWILPISCFLFFIFFAFGEEAMSDYRTVFRWLRSAILPKNFSKTNPYGSRFVLPIHRPPTIPVEVALPTTLSDIPEQRQKPWDNDTWSLKMPETAQSVPFSWNTDSSNVVDSHGALSHAETKEPTLPSHEVQTPPMSLRERPRPLSLSTIDSSSPTTIGASFPPSPTRSETPVPEDLTQSDDDLSLTGAGSPHAPHSVGAEASLAPSPAPSLHSRTDSEDN